MLSHTLKHQSAPVAVIGGGVLGVLVAYSMAEAGVQVVVVEGRDVGSGATGNTVPWINASGKRPREYFELCVESMRRWSRISDEIGGGWYRQTGNLHWAGDQSVQQSLEQRSEEARSWGYESTFLSAAQVAELEPALDLTAAVGPALFYPQEAIVHPRQMLASIQARTIAMGVRWLIGSPVIDMASRADRVTALVLGNGERLPVSGVVICAGLGTNTILDTLGSRLRMVEYDARGWVTTTKHSPYVTVHGLLVEVDDNESGIDRIVHAPGVTIFPAEGGGLVLHSMVANENVTLKTPMQPPPAASAEVLESAVRAVPSLAGARIRRAGLGSRPIPLDGLPAIGAMPSTDNCHVVLSHSAMTTGPALADAVTRSLMHEEPVPTAFDASRLLVGAA